MAESFTVFDYCAILAIGISGVIAMFRGFMREVSTLGAFFGGIFGAIYFHSYISEPTRAFLGEYTPGWLPTLIGAIIVFLVLYGLIAWLGVQLSQNIRKLEGFGLLDNLLGLVYGAVRGGVIVVFVVLIIGLGIREDELDPQITSAVTYPTFRTAANFVQSTITNWSGDVTNSTIITP